ncbi:MAG: hypothetical protein PVG66_02195 [Chromatiales bacterium]|jgi:hypothetical protein
MSTAKESGKVLIQDAAIIGAFVGLSCVISKSMEALGQTVSMGVFSLLVVAVFILLFFSNGGLFKHFANDYVWSMGSGALTLVMLVPTVMYVVHNAC